MYNNQFIDIMDKINSIAKSKNYTNGIAWARTSCENKKLNSFDYSAFEGCHDLRNLMAHGFARDIQVSGETMRIAQAFYSSIRAFQNEFIQASTSTILDQEDRIRSHDLIVREGDYVIAVEKIRWIRPNVQDIYSWKPVNGHLGDIYKVVGGKKLQFVCKNPDKCSPISELTNKYEKFYVVRPHPSIIKKYRNDIARGYFFHTVGNIRTEQDADGRCILSIEYVKRFYDSDKANLVKDTVFGYLAHPDCFKEFDPKPLYCLGPETEMEYLGWNKTPDGEDYLF